jgi:fused signal recognition particle receptor
MFKFWKKKPTDAAPGQDDAPAEERADTVADTTSVDTGAATAEALAEAPTPEPQAPDVEPEMEDTLVAAEASAAAASAEAEAPARRSWRERLSGSGFAKSLSSLFVRHPKLDDDLLDELETALITADVGVDASTKLVESLRKRMHKREFADAGALLKALRNELVALLAPVQQPLDVTTAQPFVILTVGINGVGKTTTIGKLARRYSDEGRSVLLAAGDTFRAAAVEQLKTWGERNKVPVVSQGQDADAASVIFDALQAARSRHTQVLIADTAGRLHTQGGLMDELGKIVRVMKKLDAAAPHEVLMIIDGTTGQNAISQLRQFRDTAGVTGLVVTKLDGTAKGGVMFALAREFGLPIRYVGLGETATDLRVFDAEAFVDGLLPAALGG